MSEPQVFHIVLADEIPKFRSGHRTVTVLHSGTKWVRLQCGNKKVRIPKDRWLRILKDTILYNDRNKM